MHFLSGLEIIKKESIGLQSSKRSQSVRAHVKGPRSHYITHLLQFNSIYVLSLRVIDLRSISCILKSGEPMS